MAKSRNVYSVFDRKTNAKVFEGDGLECSHFLGHENVHSFNNIKCKGTAKYYFEICGHRAPKEYRKVKCVCAQCGKEFMARAHKGPRYCSDECRKISKRVRDADNCRKKAKTERPKGRDPLVEKSLMAKKLHITYGQLVAKETIERYARVDVKKVLREMNK